MRSELTFGMPRGHVDDQSTAFAIHDSLEGLGHQLVMVTLDESRPELFDIWNELSLGFFLVRY